jgi:serine/threonine-protein kinase
VAIKCSKCHSENTDTARFCSNCATSLGGAHDPGPSLTKTLGTPIDDLAQGTLIGSEYEIIEKLGRGGMGEVYRALDRNLGRQVAIKVMPEEFSSDLERLARFEREAKLLAALNHPNIAAVHELEQSGGLRFLVLEMVEGETLQARLDRGAMAVDEALETCRQVAEGLEAAHEKGIVHRDLKPGNIMITPEGKVKILDFGLAKAYAGETTGVDIANSPTITAQMTEPGVILGTAAYMSPEQARGRSVDKRADIWAFGCVLYECLTGKRAFQGETVSDTLAQILKGEPDWGVLPANMPTALRALIRRCLQKNPKNRWHDIGDVRIEIEEAGSQPAEEDAGIRPFPLGRRLFLAAVVLAAGTLIGVLAERSMRRSEAAQVIRATVSLPTGTALTRTQGPIRTEVALSPDGSSLVFSAGPDGSGSKAMLFRRPLDSTEATPIPGTEGARIPYFSPDGRRIGFWARGKLFIMAVTGGIPNPLCDIDELPFGICWGSDGRIVFGTSRWGLQCISEAYGMPVTLAMFDATKEVPLRQPCLLPGGKALLFTSLPFSGSVGARVELLSFRTGKRKVIISDGADARYLPTGHLVFVRRGTLMAAPFDLDQLKITGSAVSVISGLMQALNPASASENSAAGQYSFSESGTLVYASGGIFKDVEFHHFWFDRSGQAEPWAEFGNRPAVEVRLSPDGRSAAFTTIGSNRNLWAYDIQRNAPTKLTSYGAAEYVTWTPDGKRVAFSWTKSGLSNIWWMPWDGSGEMEQLTKSAFSQYPSSWTRDGKYLALVEANPSTGNDILVLRMEDKRVIRFAAGISHESWPEFSPDGRWLAYASDETGSDEIYLRSFPGGNRKVTISNQGGHAPLWAPDGRELFYWNNSYTSLMKVDISAGPDLPPGTPKKLFDFVAGWSSPIRAYDISPDGRRFLIRGLPEFVLTNVTQLNLVQNWFKELKRLAPTGKK